MDIDLAKSTYIGLTSNNDKVRYYLFDYFSCGKEMKKTAYYAKRSLGYCKNCSRKQKRKERIVSGDKKCRLCLEIKPIINFSIRNTGIHRNECKTCWRDKNLYNSFKITLSQYKELSNNQNNTCAICFSEFSPNGQNLSVDHCHKTGIIRGLLCSECNFGLGKFKDNIELLNNAIKYLKKDEFLEQNKTKN